MTVTNINATDSAAIRRDTEVVTAFHQVGAVNSPYDEWYYRGLLYFDLSSIPAGASINSASISLYLTANYGSNSGSYSMHMVSMAWVGSQVTRLKRTSSANWDTIGGSFEANTSFASSVLSSSESSGYKTFTALALGRNNLSDMIRGTKSNYGWLVKNSENASRMHGFDYNTYKPILSINYTVSMPRAVTMFF